MRVAVISDVHANRHALDAVLSAVDGETVDAIWCLGDTVGYGPQPNECCDLLRERADLCLIGNHDLVALGELTVTDFNDEAAAAAMWTSEQLTAESEGRSGLGEQRARGLVEAQADIIEFSDGEWDTVVSARDEHLAIRQQGRRMPLARGVHRVVGDPCAGCGVLERNEVEGER